MKKYKYYSLHDVLRPSLSKRTHLCFFGCLLLLLYLQGNALVSQPKDTSTPDPNQKRTELDSYIMVRPFSEGQKRRYNALVKEIREVQLKIESYYEHLQLNSENDDCLSAYGGEEVYCGYYKINKKTQMTYVPLQAIRETNYGIRQKKFYTELAYFKWNGSKIVSFFFETRKAFLGTTHVLTRLFYGNSIAHNGEGVNEKRPPLGLVINEVLPTGKGTLAQFAFADKKRIFDKQHDTIEINGRKIKLSTVYLRDPEERLAMVRKYLDLLKRLEVRLQWNVHYKNARRSAELERMLRE